MPDGGQCRSCGAAVLWVMTTRGKRMPIDPDPVRDGNIVLRDGTAVYAARGVPVPAGEARYVSHFASCPHAQMHRRKP